MTIFSPHDIDPVIRLLSEGGVLIYPTETSYALGCDATNEAAVARIFAIKGRPDGKGTPIILPANAHPEEFAEMSRTAHELVTQYWPGPLNVVARRAPASLVSVRCETGGSQSVRKSSHPVASELATLLGKPLVATSANRADQPSIYSAEAIVHVFSEGLVPDAFLNVGDLPVAPASTTIRVEGDKVEVIRQGSIAVQL